MTTMTASAKFRADYPFRCASCNGAGAEGDWACSPMRGVVFHIDCAGLTLGRRALRLGGLSSVSLTEKPERDEEPTYVVRGARNPTRCGECHLEHSGDCW